MSSTPAGTLSVPEAADEEALAADRKNVSFYLVCYSLLNVRRLTD
jgi:hypothetical protein